MNALSPHLPQAFLTAYGYMSSSDFRSSALLSDDHLTKAIEKMQRYGGLNASGRLDVETLGLLQKRRCGNPDTDYVYENSNANQASPQTEQQVNFETGHSSRSEQSAQRHSAQPSDANALQFQLNNKRRSKRYALNGEKWPSNRVTWK